MKPTYTSRPINTVDMPVPVKPRLAFYYNFFESNERVNDTPPKLSRPLTALTPKELARKIPRYVSINWAKVHFDKKRSVEQASQPMLERSRHPCFQELLRFLPGFAQCDHR